MLMHGYSAYDQMTVIMTNDPGTKLQFIYQIIIWYRYLVDSTSYKQIKKLRIWVRKKAPSSLWRSPNYYRDYNIIFT